MEVNKCRCSEAAGGSGCLLSVAMVVGVMGVPRRQAREGSDGQAGKRVLPTLYGHSRSCGEGAVG